MDWTTWFEFTLTGLGTIMAFAALFAGVGYFRKGQSDGKLDTITLFKERVDALEKKIKVQTTDLESLGQKVQELTDAIREKDKKLAETLEILQGKDPGTKAFMMAMVEYTKKGSSILDALDQEIFPIIRKLKDFLEVQKQFH